MAPQDLCQETFQASTNADAPAHDAEIVGQVKLKACMTCYQIKPETLFLAKDKKRGTYRPHCLECNRIKQKENYNENKSYYIEKAAKNTAFYRRRNKAIVEEALCGKACSGCGADFELRFFQGAKAKEQPVYMAVASGASEAALHEAIARSHILCGACVSGAFVGFFMDWAKSSGKERRELQAARAKVGFAPVPQEEYRRYKPVSYGEASS